MIKLKPENATCNFCCSDVREDDGWLECVECGHRMREADFPASDRALHNASAQAREFQRECYQ